ncbi:hypothetical protein BGY98DRAFT_1015665 [Russula aff. rugulosa BPL654]|nr:hypothetical protein BGY98DRAFT_1015665 [Russula aff. rugulosa BPL654]
MGPYLILIVSYKSRLGLARRIYFAEGQKVGKFGTALVIAFVSKHLIVLAREHNRRRRRNFTLRTACILKLRSLHPSTRVWFHTHNRTPFASNFSTPALHSNRLPFRSSPADAILGFEISLRRHRRRNYEAFPHPAQAWAEESAARHARVGISAGQSDQRHLHDLSSSTLVAMGSSIDSVARVQR